MIGNRAGSQSSCIEPRSAQGGDVESGKSLAGVYSRSLPRARCESRGINPFDYLADVLARVQDHPANAVDELLPGAWAAGR